MNLGVCCCHWSWCSVAGTGSNCCWWKRKGSGRRREEEGGSRGDWLLLMSFTAAGPGSSAAPALALPWTAPREQGVRSSDHQHHAPRAWIVDPPPSNTKITPSSFSVPSRPSEKNKHVRERGKKEEEDENLQPRGLKQRKRVLCLHSCKVGI